jgi:hypothetical protein
MFGDSQVNTPGTEYVITGSGRTLCSPPVREEPGRNLEGSAHELTVCVGLGTDEADGVVVLCGMVTEKNRDSATSLHTWYRCCSQPI